MIKFVHSRAHIVYFVAVYYVNVYDYLLMPCRSCIQAVINDKAFKFP